MRDIPFALSLRFSAFYFMEWKSWFHDLNKFLLQIQELVGGSTLQLQCILMFWVFILACADTVFCREGKV
jgi:hypothetical protein